MHKPNIISIIVPVYNMESCIERCLESIINQSIEEIDIILVDDGSKDSSLEIEQMYAKKDARVRVFRRENHGVSAARNFGLRNAKGTYIAFVDSDDEIECDFCKILFTNIGEADICVGSVDKIKLNGRRQIAFSKIEDYFSENGEEALGDILQWKNCSQIICNKLFRIDFLKENRLQFHEGRGFEDWIFALESSAKARSISFVPDVVYKYWERQESATTTTVLNNKIAYDYLYVLGIMKKVLQERGCLERYKKEYENHLRFDLYYLNRLFLEKSIIDTETYQKVGKEVTAMIHDARHL